MKLSIQFFGHTHSIWKFPDQGLNPHHISDPSPSSGNAGSLIRRAARELRHVIFMCGAQTLREMKAQSTQKLHFHSHVLTVVLKIKCLGTIISI